MKESHSEDQASHAGPESCEGVREGALEALTGEPAGRAIEPRNQVILREADLLMVRGRQHRARRHGKACPAPARSKNQGMWGSFSRGSREISGSAQPEWCPVGPRMESQGNKNAMNEPRSRTTPIVSKKPANKVRLRSSAAEPVEKRETGQRQSEPANQPPDTGPGAAATCAGKDTSSSERDRKQRMTNLWHHVYDVRSAAGGLLCEQSQRGRRSRR